MNTNPLIEHNQLAYLHMFEMIILHGVPLVARGSNFIELEDHQIKIQAQSLKANGQKMLSMIEFLGY